MPKAQKKNVDQNAEVARLKRARERANWRVRLTCVARQAHITSSREEREDKRKINGGKAASANLQARRRVVQKLGDEVNEVTFFGS